MMMNEKKGNEGWMVMNEIHRNKQMNESYMNEIMRMNWRVVNEQDLNVKMVNEKCLDERDSFTMTDEW